MGQYFIKGMIGILSLVKYWMGPQFKSKMVLVQLYPLSGGPPTHFQVGAPSPFRIDQSS